MSKLAKFLELLSEDEVTFVREILISDNFNHDQKRNKILKLICCAPSALMAFNVWWKKERPTCSDALLSDLPPNIRLLAQKCLDYGDYEGLETLLGGHTNEMNTFLAWKEEQNQQPAISTSEVVYDLSNLSPSQKIVAEQLRNNKDNEGLEELVNKPVSSSASTVFDKWPAPNFTPRRPISMAHVGKEGELETGVTQSPEPIHVTSKTAVEEIPDADAIPKLEEDVQQHEESRRIVWNIDDDFQNRNRFRGSYQISTDDSALQLLHYQRETELDDRRQLHTEAQLADDSVSIMLCRTHYL